jgi:hypothetical protein
MGFPTRKTGFFAEAWHFTPRATWDTALSSDSITHGNQALEQADTVRVPCPVVQRPH